MTMAFSYMIKKILITFLLLCCIVIIAENVRLTGIVTVVHDGDSFTLTSGPQNYEIRLWGIDAPEYLQNGGREATKYLIMLIKSIEVTVEKVDVDGYGRTVAKVYRKDQYINLAMITAGQAWWYKRYAPNEDSFRNAEKKARDKKIGLWRETNPVNPRDWRLEHKDNE